MMFNFRHKDEVFFWDYQIHFGLSSRFFLSVITSTAYGLLVVVTLFSLFSGSPVFELGVLLSLFLIYRAVRFSFGERTVFQLRRARRKNVALAYRPGVLRVLRTSYYTCLSEQKPYHLVLLQEILKLKEVGGVFLRLDVPISDFMQELSRRSSLDHGEEAKNPDTALQVVTLAAYKSALQHEESYIDVYAILFALSKVNDQSLSEIFSLFGVLAEDLSTAVMCARFQKRFHKRILPYELGGSRPMVRVSHPFTNRAWTARPTPMLDQSSVDFTELASHEDIDIFVGHERELRELQNAISQLDNSNILLLGEAGSGKSTIVYHLAHLMLREEVPLFLFDKRLVRFSLQDLIARTSKQDLFQKIRVIVEEVTLASNVVLYVPDLHLLFSEGEGELVNAAQIFVPLIRNTSILLIAATTPSSFQTSIRKHTDLLTLFRTIEVHEIESTEAVTLLSYASVVYEKQYGVRFTVPAIRAIVLLARQYFREHLLPRSALQLLQDVLLRARREGESVLREDLVYRVCEEKVGVPVQKPYLEESHKLLNLEAYIHEEFVGQDEAVSAVSRALREYRAKLSRRGGPIASFLFVGPTGVGKTELAHMLAKIQFGSRDRLLRLDMSEYQARESVSRLIGDLDTGTPGQLTEEVRKQPFQVILLDEFEKANHDVLNLFLQVFDAGRLTDVMGVTVDFRDTILIATSNADSEFIVSGIKSGEKFSKIARDVRERLFRTFRPELLNRFSEIVVFSPLTFQEAVQVSNFLVKDVIRSMKESHDITLVFQESALRKLTELGYDEAYGARPLRRVISEKIRSPLAQKILLNEFERGDEVLVKSDGREFQFEVMRS